MHRGNLGYQQSGTAFPYIGKDLPYRMAGKSGTAQVVGIKQGETYNEKELSEFQRKHAWFIAFAPADAPEIAVSVLVENGGGGSAFASPVARKVIDAYLLPTLCRVTMSSRDFVRSLPGGGGSLAARRLNNMHLDPLLLAALLAVIAFGLVVLFSALGRDIARSTAR